MLSSAIHKKQCAILTSRRGSLGSQLSLFRPSPLSLQPQRFRAACLPQQNPTDEEVRQFDRPANITFQLLDSSSPSTSTSSSSSSSEFQYDEETKTMKVPLSALEGEGATRRTRLVTFTCGKCGGRTTRAVNPIAWEKGLVMGQCKECKVWHVLSAKNKDIYEEVNFKDQGDQGLEA